MCVQSLKQALSAFRTKRFCLLLQSGNTKWGGVTVPLTSCLTCLDLPVLQIKTKIVICHTAYSKPVKREVNRTVILPPLVFPASIINHAFNISALARYMYVRPRVFEI
jgi:hypothetical protein